MRLLKREPSHRHIFAVAQTCEPFIGEQLGFAFMAGLMCEAGLLEVLPSLLQKAVSEELGPLTLAVCRLVGREACWLPGCGLTPCKRALRHVDGCGCSDCTHRMLHDGSTHALVH
jgi:hypothetical protein